jgi:hypothetical protein
MVMREGWQHTKALAVEKPMPFLFTPVTITVLPFMLEANAFATSSASVWSLYVGLVVAAMVMVNRLRIGTGVVSEGKYYEQNAS